MSARQVENYAEEEKFNRFKCLKSKRTRKVNKKEERGTTKKKQNQKKFT